MTIGSKTWDQTTPFTGIVVSYPSGNISYESPKPAGNWVHKDWSGGDLPKTRPEMVDVYWREPSYWKLAKRGFSLNARAYRKVSKKPGKLHRKRIRKDLVSRPKSRDPHSYLMHYQSYQYPIIELHYYNGDGSKSSDRITSLYGLDSPIGNAGNYWDSNDDIALIGKLRDKIQGDSFNLAVSLAEGREALGLIAHTAMRIVRGYELARKGKIGDALKTLLLFPSDHAGRAPSPRGLKKNRELIAQQHLEIQYGVRPLLQDVHSAATFLGRVLSVPLEQTYRVRKRKWLTGYGRTSYLENRVGSVQSGQIVATVKEVNIPALIGLTDPAAVIWEKTPWSFVADWFIPISNWLAARGLANSISGKFVTTYMTRENNLWTGIDLGWAKSDPFIALNRYVKMDRQVTSFLSVPPPHVKTLSESASWQHCANAVALLVTTLGGNGSPPKIPSLNRVGPRR